MVRRRGDRAGGFNHPVDVGLGDFALANGHHAVRIDTLDVAAGNPGKHFMNGAIRHQLGFFHRALNGLDGGLDIDHHALFQATRRSLPHADDIQRTVFEHLGHDGDNLGGANIQPDQHVFRFSRFAHHLLR